MLSDREVEKARLERQLTAPVATDRTVVAHPALVKRYEQKVATLREALNDETIKADAIRAVRSLIGSVTVHVDDDGRTGLEVEASTSTLIGKRSFGPTLNGTG